MSTPPDETCDVRAGEELPLAALEPFLAAHVPGLGPCVARQFPGGYSNLTYLLRDASGREVVLRRPPRGAAVRGAHDVTREHRLLCALHPVWPRVPRPLAVCPDAGLIGAPFFVMERVRGVIPRAADGLAPEQARARAEALVEAMAELHALDVTRPEWYDLGRPQGYARRQVDGWAERYARARTDDVPELEALVGWLDEALPADGASALIHNDYKLDNVVFDEHAPTRVVALLDWEMATLGDPLLDLGTTLAYWAEPDDPQAWRRFSVVPATLAPGCLSRAEVVERYARSTGRALDGQAVLFAYVFGLFKVAVIAQQIYARFRQGHTNDARFAGLAQVVRGCGRMAQRALDLGRIDRLG